MTPSGRWLIQLRDRLTTEQLTAARQLAAGADMTIEWRDEQGGLRALRSGATIAGILLALGVLAMMVGLIRSEAAGDLRILTAIGASPTTRRTLTATTSGGLALLGVILGTTGAYLALIAAHVDGIGTIASMPTTQLAAIVFGTPLLAQAAGWIHAGREPKTLTRRAATD